MKCSSNQYACSLPIWKIAPLHLPLRVTTYSIQSIKAARAPERQNARITERKGTNIPYPFLHICFFCFSCYRMLDYRYSVVDHICTSYTKCRKCTNCQRQERGDGDRAPEYPNYPRPSHLGTYIYFPLLAFSSILLSDENLNL